MRYLVPIYQRNYKWDEVEHWGPLWTHICNVADDVLEYGEGPDVVDHFLGAIVCEQQQSVGRDAKAISVIDGQQRLTTIALFIAAAHGVCADRGFTRDADYLEPMVMNRPSVVDGRLSHKYKVWPNAADREGFLSAMEECLGGTRPERAVRFFKARIGGWLDVGAEDDPFDDQEFTAEERMAALITALLRFVKIVKIDLEPNDNAEPIFETLNGRGERLTDADLIRNSLFRRADTAGLDVQALYDQYWKPFDSGRWPDPVVHGRHQKDRLSLFLSQWLSLKELSEVPASALFRRFNDYVQASASPADVVAKELSDFAVVFDSFDRFQRSTREW